jgi:hypothetical protein
MATRTTRYSEHAGNVDNRLVLLLLDHLTDPSDIADRVLEQH